MDILRKASLLFIKINILLSYILCSYFLLYDQWRIILFSFTSIIEVPVGITSESFNLGFSLTTGIIQKLSKTTRNKK